LWVGFGGGEGDGEKGARALPPSTDCALAWKWGAVDPSRRRRDEAVPYNTVGAVPEPSEHEPPLSPHEATR